MNGTAITMNQQQTKDRYTGTLTHDPIPRLIWKMAVPASIGFFFHTMFNVTDTWFAGRISTEAVAALSLSFPLFFIILSIASGFSTGVTALVGDALGSGNREAAASYAIQTVIMGTIGALLLTLFGVAALPTLFGWLGATETYLKTSLAYMNIIFGGTLCFMMSFIFNGLLNALGETRPNRNFLIIAFFANMALDPWFIMGGLGLPALGISGVAIATVLCELGGAVYLGIKAFRFGLFSAATPTCCIPQMKLMLDIARQGVPAAFSTATVGMGIFIITYFVSRFGQVPVAAYGIAVRIEQLVLLPTIGLNVATLAIVSQNSGAKMGHRVYETMRLAIRYGGRIMIPAGGVVLVAADWLMSLFSEEPIGDSSRG